MTEQSNKILYLNSSLVKRICKKLNAINIIGEIFELHASKQTILPDEAYLSWKNKNAESARSLNMPAFLGGNYQIAGTKIINSNISNTKKGINRAAGLTLLFDAFTARVVCIMEGAYISSLRTAAVSILAIDLLKRKDRVIDVSIIGLGIQGKMHLGYLLAHVSKVGKIYVFDNDPFQIKKTIGSLALKNKVVIVNSAKEAIVNSDVIITTTTSSKGYIKFSWLRKGALVIHVSLDDLLPDAIGKADKLIVDDWNLVKNDDKRIFGKMYRKGILKGPGSHKGIKPYIYAEFSEIISVKKGRKNNDEIIIFNPFGLSMEDIGIACHIYKIALKKKMGRMLDY